MHGRHQTALPASHSGSAPRPCRRLQSRLALRPCRPWPIAFPCLSF